MSSDLKWQFDESNMYTSERAEELQRAIQESGVVKEKEKDMVYPFCVLLMHTRGVSFDPSKVQSNSLKKLPDFLANWKEMTPEQLWGYRREHVSHRLWNQWANDFASEGSLFVTDPALLPDALLSDELKAQANTPHSPLP